MTTKNIILTVFEFVLCTGAIGAAFNEEKFIAFEDKLKKKLKKFLEVIRCK